MQNTKKTKLDYTVEVLKADNNGSVASTTLAFAMTANAMPATQEKAPYLLRPVMGPSMEVDEFAAEMLKEAGQGTLTEAKYYANVIDEVLEKLLADGKTSVDTGWFSAAPAISGSVPFCNSEITEENEIYIALLPCLDTRKLVAMMETASSATDRPFDIKEVFDVETNKPGIVAGKPFYVFGQSFSADMTATLIDAAGGEHPCTTPVRDRIPTRLTFTAPAQIAAGKYALALTGKGSGEEPVTQKKPNVAVKSEWTPPVGPAVDDIASEGHEGEIVSGTAFAAKGSGLDAFDAEAGDNVKVKWTQGGEDKEATIEPEEVTGEKMSFEFPDALVGVPVDTELTFEITFGETVKTKGSKLVGE